MSAPDWADLVDSSATRRFWSKVDKSVDCWVWLPTPNASGYGRIVLGARPNQRWVLAHRLSWFMARGSLTDGLVLDHLCRVRRCVNPDHLEEVTLIENMFRGHVGDLASMTHCARGHEFTPENTYRKPHASARNCRECRRDRDRRKVA